MNKLYLLFLAFLAIFLIALSFLYVQSDSSIYGEEISSELDECESKSVILIESRRDCFTAIAVKELDISICDRIPKYPYTEGTYALAKERCQFDFFQTYDDISICGQYPELKNTCYEAFAFSTSNPSLCDSIADTNNRDYCFLRLASNLTNHSLCQKIQNLTHIRPYCYYAIGEKTNNLSLCDMALDDSYLDSRNNCYYDVAKATNNYTACSQISRNYKKDECYYGIAKSTNNLSICQKIGQRGLRIDCEEY